MRHDGGGTRGGIFLKQPEAPFETLCRDLRIKSACLNAAVIVNRSSLLLSKRETIIASMSARNDAIRQHLLLGQLDGIQDLLFWEMTLGHHLKNEVSQPRSFFDRPLHM